MKSSLCVSIERIAMENCIEHVTTVPTYCRDTIAARDRSVAERDTNNAGLQRQIEALTDRLKVLYTTMTNYPVCSTSMH